MAEVLFDDSISSEEILDVRRSLQEIVRFYQSQLLKEAIKDESAVLVTVRSEVSGLRSSNVALEDTLNTYSNFTLDHVKAGQDVNKLKTFSEISETKGVLPLTPGILSESKKEVDEFVQSINDGNNSQDRTLESLNAGTQGQQLSTTQANVNASRDSITPVTPRLTGENLNPSEYQGRFKNHIITECIPCLGRVTSAENIRPLADLSDLIRINISNTSVALNRLLGLLYNDEVLNDICNLMGFFKFMCVPDLMALSSFLGLLFAKYTDMASISLSGTSLTGLITPIFTPIVSSIVALLDRFLSLIGAPVECMIESLDDIIANIDLQAGVQQFRASNVQYQISQKLALQGSLLQQKSELKRKSSALRRQINSLVKENPETNIDRIKALRRELKSLGYTEEGNIIRGGPADKNRIKFEALRSEISSLEGSLPTKKTTLQETREKLRNIENSFGKGLKDLRQLMFQGQNLVRESLRSNLEELQKVLGLNAENTLASIEIAQNLQRISRMLSLVKFIARTLDKGGDPCDPNTNTSSIVGSFLRHTNSQNPLGQSNPNDFDLSPVPQIVKGQFGEDAKLIVFPAGAVLQITGVDQTPRDIEEVKKFNASGELPDIGDLAGADITAIIPEVQTAVSPTIIPLDLCVRSGDPGTADKIKDWVSTIKQ